MRDLDGRRLHSRVTGRAALVRSLRGLLIRGHRFGESRARTRDDLRWAARLVDGLTATLDTVTRDSHDTPREAAH